MPLLFPSLHQDNQFFFHLFQEDKFGWLDYRMTDDRKNEWVYNVTLFQS